MPCFWFTVKQTCGKGSIIFLPGSGTDAVCGHGGQDECTQAAGSTFKEHWWYEESCGCKSLSFWWCNLQPGSLKSSPGTSVWATAVLQIHLQWPRPMQENEPGAGLLNHTSAWFPGIGSTWLSAQAHGSSFFVLLWFSLLIWHALRVDVILVRQTGTVIDSSLDNLPENFPQLHFLSQVCGFWSSIVSTLHSFLSSLARPVWVLYLSVEFCLYLCVAVETKMSHTS